MKKLTIILLAVFIVGIVVVLSIEPLRNIKTKTEKGKPAPAQVAAEAEAPAETEAAAAKPTEPKPVKVSASSELSSSQYNSLVRGYDAYISGYGFGGEVLVTEHNKVIYKRGAGYSDRKKKIKNNEHTIFRVASVTKQFTAAAIMILQERGKLSVKDKLSKYFPDYKYGNKITIEHLLKMRSGIPDYMNFYYNCALIFPSKKQALKNSSKENRKILEKSFMSDPLLFTPGATFKYSNSGYMLLGEIIEKVSGTTYEDFVKKEIFDKLGMTSSGFVEELDGSQKNVAKPYDYHKGSLDVFKIKGAAFACGNMYSTAYDLSKWAAGLRHNKIMSRDSFKAMVSDKSGMGYGYGFFLIGGGNVAFHTGYLCPYSAMLIMSTGGTEYTCISISNSNYYYTENLGKNFRAQYVQYF